MSTAGIALSRQAHADPNVVVYNTLYPLTAVTEFAVRGNTTELSDFMRLFLEIPGIVQVQIRPYTVIINRAPLFSWDGIRPRVEEILKAVVISQRLLEEAVDGKAETAKVQPGDRITIQGPSKTRIQKPPRIADKVG